MTNETFLVLFIWFKIKVGLYVFKMFIFRKLSVELYSVQRATCM